jgi:hypothetical protein
LNFIFIFFKTSHKGEPVNTWSLRKPSLNKYLLLCSVYVKHRYRSEIFTISSGTFDQNTCFLIPYGILEFLIFAAIVLKTLFVSPNTKIASGISVERTSYWFYIPLWFHPNVSLQHLQKKIGFLKLNLQRISHSVHNHNFDLYELKYVQNVVSQS